MRSNRRGTSRPRSYTSASDVGGGGLALYGLVKPAQPGWTSPIDPRTSDPNRFYNLKESVPLLGKDPNMAGNRAAVGTGVIIAAGGRVLRHFVRSPKLKLKGSRKGIKLFGASS